MFHISEIIVFWVTLAVVTAQFVASPTWVRLVIGILCAIGAFIIGFKHPQGLRKS